MGKNVRVVPIKNALAVSYSCHDYLQVNSSKIKNNEIINRALDYILGHLPDHSQRENIDLYILNNGSDCGSKSEYELLIVHNHFEHLGIGGDIIHLPPLFNILLELSRFGGCVSLDYHNLWYEKLIIRVDEIDDYELIREIFENSEGWLNEPKGPLSKNCSVCNGLVFECDICERNEIMLEGEFRCMFNGKKHICYDCIDGRSDEER